MPVNWSRQQQEVGQPSGRLEEFPGGPQGLEALHGVGQQQHPVEERLQDRAQGPLATHQANDLDPYTEAEGSRLKLAPDGFVLGGRRI